MDAYPKIWNLGHRAIADLFKDEVVIQEKVDGSQFSFGLDLNGELRCRSKGADINTELPEKMFSKAVEFVKTNLVPLAPSESMTVGVVYRCEYLQKPKHNTLAYDRVPQNNLVLFDVSYGGESYCIEREHLEATARRFGIDVIPEIFRGTITDPSTLLEFLKMGSFLGGQKIEGVVVKNYHRFGIDGHILLGKYVSEEFKEKHGKEWRESNPTSKDIVQQLVLQYRTPARWAKAVQHLREVGTLTDSPKDIGLIMREVQADTLSECRDEIKDALFEHAEKHILRGIIGGVAEWYKEELLKNQFNL